MLFFLCICLVLSRTVVNARPNIIIFLADDLGWNDVGFHGSNQIPTPNIDALAYSGIALHNYYVNPMCTPSRSALMTGKYPIHTGMQHGVIRANEPRGLPLSEKILPQYLKDLGYKTHLVGKWHLGHYKKEYLPMNRGFDSHLGFWGGKIDMYEHTSVDEISWAFDFRRGFEVADDLYGLYATDVYTDEAVKIISSHNSSSPLFLMVSHSAVHSGNPSEYIRAPDYVIDNFMHIEDTQRRKFAGMLSKLDESVGAVMESLSKNGLLENSIIIFSTDNGGPAAGFNNNAASNYPFKGVKNTAWEGGVRGAALMWSPLIKHPSRVATQRFHLVDWLPTLYSAAGGNVSVFKNLDGMDLWEALIEDRPSQRTTVLHNIDDVWGYASLTVDNWKLHVGTNLNGTGDHWFGPAGRDGTYYLHFVYYCLSADAIKKIRPMPNRDTILSLREAATVKCDENIPRTSCLPKEAPCLFNIDEDPCERRNLADEQPTILNSLLSKLQEFNRTALPPNNKPLDPRGNPNNWGHVVTNFGDYETKEVPIVCI